VAREVYVAEEAVAVEMLLLSQLVRAVPEV
jgi:hypothetical protein